MTSLFMKEELGLKPFIYLSVRRRLKPSDILLFMEANSTWHHCMTSPHPCKNNSKFRPQLENLDNLTRIHLLLTRLPVPSKK